MNDLAAALLWDVSASPGKDLTCHVIVDDATGAARSAVLARGTQLIAEWVPAKE